MDETATKADVAQLQKDLQEEIRATGTRLAAAIDEVDQRLGKKIDEVDQRLGKKIDEVDQRLGKKIDEVDQRLDAKMDAGFGMVARQFVETEERLKRHTDMRFEALREDVKKLADGVIASNEQLAKHIQRSDAEHARLDRAILAGDAAINTRVTALEQRAQG